MKNKFLLFLSMSITIIMSITSCGLKTGYLKYEGKGNEIIVTEKIKEFMKENESPSIVLKVPKTEQKSTESDLNNYIYSAIEKELALAGFNVKDRGLYNEIVGKADAIDYNELKKLTKTDLILELVNIDREIKYVTNVLYTQDGEERYYEDYHFDRYGAVIEFKITIIENNQYGGSYTFNYNPCENINKDKCICQVGYKKLPNKAYPHLNMCNVDNEIEKYDLVERNVLEEFVRDGVKKMIAEIKK